MEFEKMKIADSGMSSEKLYQMVQELETQAEIHSIVILKEGKAVLEGSWAPYSLSEPQMMHSMSKLGIAICTGFAIDEGKLRLEDHFLDYVREDLPEEYDPVLENITIYDLLTMQAGSKKCANNVYFTALRSDWEKNWLKEEKIPEDIHNAFYYDSGCSYTLSLIMSRLFGKTCIEILQERVFDRMQLGRVDWLSSPEGYSTGGWGMYLNARQIAALGQLLIQKGNWGGEQLIPAFWAEEITKPRIAKPGMEGRTLSHYGYQMHIGEKVFAGEGAFEQLMICFRDVPVVIGITAGTNNNHVPDICEKYILEAVAEGAASWADDKLERKVASLQVKKPAGKQCSSAVAGKLSGKWIRLEKNPRGIRKVLINEDGENSLRIKVELESGGVQTLWAGYRLWIKNDLYTDYTKRFHYLSYGFTEDALYITDCMINTSYREEYMFRIHCDELICGWKPNVTYLDGNDNSQRIFAGTIEGM